MIPLIRQRVKTDGILTPDTLEAQVIAWLDEEAAKPEWQQYQEASRQMTLF